MRVFRLFSPRRVAGGTMFAAAVFGAGEARAPMESPNAPGWRTESVTDDARDVRSDLQKKITRFQDTWREEWERVQFAQHGWLDTRGIGSIINARDANVRRYWALGCARLTPRLVPFQPPSPVARRPVVAKPDRGAVCPLWSPPDDGEPPDEGEAIDLALPITDRARMQASRDTLIAALETAHAQHPDDDWIAGQRVRFVFDQRSPARTLAAALACRGNVGWCAALVGLAHAQAGQLQQAEAAFRMADSVIATTTKGADCSDADMLALIIPDDRPTVERMSCEERRAFALRLWWLADPLWSTSGNERYVAHQTRRVQAALRAISDRDERYVWAAAGGGDAMRQMVVRYGWPSYTYWPGWQYENGIGRSLERQSPLRRQPHALNSVRPPRAVFFPYTVKEYTLDRTALLPKTDAIIDPFSLTAADWSLKNPDSNNPDSWWPQEHMMLSLHLAPLGPGQDALWRRDSTISYQLAVDDPLRVLDTAVTGASLALLMGGSSANAAQLLARSAIGESLTLRLFTQLTSAPVVLSAEVLPRSPREHALRLRYGVRPPPTLRDMKDSEVALSDPVFLRLANRIMDPPTDMESVLRYMAGGLTFPRSESVALYWESYGFASADTVQIEMRVRRDDDVSATRRLGARLGVVSAMRDSISIRWTEPDARRSGLAAASSRPVVGRTVALDLQALAPGGYVVAITVRTSRASARSERRFVITEP